MCIGFWRERGGREGGEVGAGVESGFGWQWTFPAHQIVM